MTPGSSQRSVRIMKRTPMPAAKMIVPNQIRWATQSGVPIVSKNQ